MASHIIMITNITPLAMRDPRVCPHRFDRLRGLIGYGSAERIVHSVNVDDGFVVHVSGYEHDARHALVPLCPRYTAMDEWAEIAHFAEIVEFGNARAVRH